MAAGLPAARKLAAELLESDLLRGANQRFLGLRGAWVTHALYLSPEVDELLTAAIGHLATMSVLVDELLEGNGVNYNDRVPPHDALVATTLQVRERMRAEMSAGFNARPVPAIEQEGD